MSRLGLRLLPMAVARRLWILDRICLSSLSFDCIQAKRTPVLFAHWQMSVRHGNLWILGGEIIRDLNYTPSLRKVAAQRLLREAVHADGGPLIHNCARRHTSMSRMKISDLRNWRRRWDSDSLHIKKRRNLPRYRPCGWLSAQSSHNSVFWPVIVTCPVHRA